MKRITSMGGWFVRACGILSLAAVSLSTAQAQSTVEEQLAAMQKQMAAMQARMQQLEQELAASKAAPSEIAGVKPVNDTASGVVIRPAVMSTAEPIAAAAAEPQAAGAPPEKSTEEKIKDLDFDALGFFKGTKMSGLLDIYYLYDFNKPASAIVPFRNFDFNAKSITLNLAEINLTKAVSKETRVGYNFTFAVGPTADIVNGSDPMGAKVTATNFLQYYLSGFVPLGKGLTIDVGKWVTPFGAEVIETPSNWNYSRSLLFTLAIPYYHFGIRATQVLSDKASVSFHIANGWNNVVDNNGGKTYGAMLTLNPSPHFSLVQTWMGGPEQKGNDDNYRHTYDAVLTVPSKKVSFMTDFVVAHESKAAVDGSDVMWYGVALYGKFQMSPKFALIPRWEWFNDRDGFTTGTPQKMKEFTITPEITFNDHLLTRLEYRRDYSDEASYIRGASSPGKSQDTVAGGLILKF